MSTLKEVDLDFETRSACDLSEAGALRYSEDFSTEILCLTFKFERGEYLWVPNFQSTVNERAEELLRSLAEDSSATFKCFSGFEQAIWNIMVRDFGFPELPVHRWHDVQAAAAMKAMPLNLDMLGQAMDLKHKKSKEGKALISRLNTYDKKTGSFHNDQETLDSLYEYCFDDIRAQSEAHGRLGYLPPGERRIWLINQRINARGIRIDLPLVRKAQEIVAKVKRVLVPEWQKITGIEKLGSPKFLDWLNSNGCPTPNLQKATIKLILGGSVDEDDESDVVGLDDGLLDLDLSDPVRRALTIKQLVGSTSVTKLDAMQACVCDDGRAHGLLQYHGAGPGRSTGRLLQPHNIPKPTLKLGKETYPIEPLVEAIMSGDPEYVELVVGAPIAAVVQCLRHMLISADDRVFCSADYAGIQLRTLLALSGQHDTCAKLLTPGYNAYVEMAEKIYKRPIDKHNDVKEYTIGKNSVLGLGFQMGGKTFRVKYARNFPLEFCEDVVEVYRKEWAPKVRYVWYGLEEAAAKCVWDRTPQTIYGVTYAIDGEWLTVRLPSGRKLWYYGPEPTKQTCPWTDKRTGRPAVKNAFTYQAVKLGQWKTIPAFGGQLCENVVMGIECDIAREAMVKLENNNFPVVLEVHDEIVVEPKIKDADTKAIEQILLDVPGWVKEMGIPIGVEQWQGNRYRK
jgi:DNA polymerase